MQENTPAQGVEIKELKGVEIEITPKKAIRINKNFLGSYKHLEGIVDHKDYLIPLYAIRLDNDTFAIVVKVINMNAARSKEYPAQGKIKEIKGVVIEIPWRKAIRLNDDLWGPYKYLKGIVSPDDYLIPLYVLRLNNDTFAIVVKVINVNKAVMDNGKE